MPVKDRAFCSKCAKLAVVRYDGSLTMHTHPNSRHRYDYCYGPKPYNYYMGGEGYEPFQNAAFYARDRIPRAMTEPRLITIEQCNRFFIVEQRWGYDRPTGACESTGYPPPDDAFETAYIFNAMAGPYVRVYREWVNTENRRPTDRYRPSFVYIVEARNKRQVVAKMLELGHVCMFNSVMQYPFFPPAQEFKYEMKEGLNMNPNPYDVLIEQKREQYEAELASIERARLAEIERQAQMLAIRERFGANEDWPEESTISWKKQFNSGGIEYTYVAIKVGKMGGWYVTGQPGNVWYTWEKLLAELCIANSVHYVTKWEEL